jgi:hypothetical protein
VNQLHSGRYVVTWAARRHADTLEEAEQMAALPEPPPARRRSDVVSDELRTFIVQLHAGGMSAHLIAALLAEAKIPTARNGSWRAQTIKSIIEQARRADTQQVGDDELAR